MAPPRAPRARRRPRPGSLERPINARSYRGTWLLAGIPLLIAAFATWVPTPLPAPQQQPAFDGPTAVANAEALAELHSDRAPGEKGAAGAESFVADELERYGYNVVRDTFSTTVAGLGERTLVNLRAEAPGRSRDAIVVLAHRDDASGAGLNDNASGTAALLELARSYGAQGGTQTAAPNHTIVFLSTDGGAFGGIGAEHFAREALGRRTLIAALNLDAIGSKGPLRAVVASDSASSPDPTVLATLRRAVSARAGLPLRQASATHQLLDLAFPFSLYEQAPFTARGTPALTLSGAGDRPPTELAAPPPLEPGRLARVGRAAEDFVASLDQGLSSSTSTRTYIAFGARLLHGWALQLLLLAALLPAVVAIVDLFARCRRRRIPLGPALRSLRTRLGFWLWTLIAFELLVVLGLFPHGAARPVSLDTDAAQHWPLVPLVALFLCAAGGWLAARERLFPSRTLAADEELAGHTVALVGLLLISLVVLVLNRYALVFVLPSLHAWLWLPQLRERPRWVRLLVFTAGLAGPLWLLHAFATRLALGFDAPWYLMELAVVRAIPLPVLVVFTAWLAVAAQLLTLTTGRYAPYPHADELPPRGPVRESLRLLIAAGRSLHTPSAPRRRAS